MGYRGIVPERLPCGELPKAKRQAMLKGPCSGPQAKEARAFRESKGFEKQLMQPQRSRSPLLHPAARKQTKASLSREVDS